MQQHISELYEPDSRGDAPCLLLGIMAKLCRRGKEELMPSQKQEGEMGQG